LAPSERIGVGMIGLGRQCIARNLPVFMKRGDCEVVALCDVDRQRLTVRDVPFVQASAKRHKWDPDRLRSCFRTTDFRELLNRKDVDAVMISTPDHWHPTIAVAAIQAGKDVCCEKPLGLAIAHGRAIADAAAKAKCVFRTDSEFRSIPHLYKAVALVRTGRIGELKRIRIAVPVYWGALPMQPEMPVPEWLEYDMWLGPAPKAPYTEKRVHTNKLHDRPGWFSNRDYCDGMISNWGYHPCDVAQWANDTELTGPVEIEGRGDFPPKHYLWNTILDFDVHYRYANGVEMFYIGRQQYKTHPDYAGSQAFMRFEGTEGWVCGWYGPDRLDAEPKTLLDVKITPEEFPFPLKNEKHDFLDCVRSRSRTLEDAEVGHRSSTVAQLGYIACQVGRRLRWDPEKERFPDDEEAQALLNRPCREPWQIPVG